MSTRGIIAQAKGDGFEGVYQHSDSYPNGLGPDLWQALQARGAKAVVVEDIEAHRGGWSTYPDRCYCHTMERNGPEMVMTQSQADWLFIEWGYVIDPDSNRLGVVVGLVREPGDHAEFSERNGNRREWREDNYGYRLVGSFPIDGPEPEWSVLEEQGEQIRDDARRALGLSV